MTIITGPFSSLWDGEGPSLIMVLWEIESLGSSLPSIMLAVTPPVAEMVGRIAVARGPRSEGKPEATIQRISRSQMKPTC